MQCKVFVSYSHDDAEWFRRVRDFLRSVEGFHVDVWSDRDIEPGAPWFERIREEVASTDIAVLLVTNNFIISDFIGENELGPFSAAAERGELDLVWIAVGYCLYDETILGQYQCVNDPNRPLESLSSADQNRQLAEITRAILSLARRKPRSGLI